MQETHEKNQSVKIQELTAELEELRLRLGELEEYEIGRVSEEQERFDTLQVLDEYARQLEESRDKLTRLMRAATAVHETGTIQEALQRVGEAVADSGWGSVTVNLFENWEVVQAAYMGCSKSDIEFLETNRRPPEERANSFGPKMDRFKVSRSYYIPADKLTEVVSPDHVCPGRRAVQPGDNWDPMDLAYVPLYGSDGRVIGNINLDDPVDGRRPTEETFLYLELFADLTVRKVEHARMMEQQRRTEAALRENESKYRTLFDHSADAYLLMDDKFLDCNSKALEIFACEKEDIINHSPVEFSPPYQPDGKRSDESAREHIESAMRGNPHSFYWLHQRKDKRLIHCEVSLAAVQVDGDVRVLAAVRDISERYCAELECDVTSQILQIANGTDDWERMIRSMVQEINKLMPVDDMCMALYNSRTKELSFPFTTEIFRSSEPLPLPQGPLEWIIRRQQAVRLNGPEIQKLINSGEACWINPKASAWLGVPLINRSRSIGLLTVQSCVADSVYDEDSERILSSVAAHLAIVAERKRVKEAAVRLAAFPRENPNPILEADDEGKIVFQNPASEKIARIHGDGRITNVLPPDHDDNIRQCLESGDNLLNVEVELKNCTLAWSYYPLKTSGVVHIYGEDVTERKKTEEKLRFAQFSINQAGDAAYWIDKYARLVEVNDVACRTLGYTREELTSMTVMDIDPDMTEEIWEQTWRKKSPEKSMTMTTYHKRKDGSVLPVEILCSQIKYKGREFSWTLARDITERRRHEEALRVSEQWARALVEASFEALVIHENGIIKDVNHALTELTGYAREELVGKSVYSLIGTKESAVIRSKVSARTEQPYQISCVVRNGDVKKIEIRGRNLKFRGKPVRVAAIREIESPEAVRNSQNEEGKPGD